MMTNEKLRILCVDDEKNILKAFKRLFINDDYEIFTATDPDEGIEILKKINPIQIVISDFRMPSKNGIEFLKEVYEQWPDTVRIMLSGYADTEAVINAINEGQIYKFIPKPWNDSELKVAISNAFERYFLYKKNIELTKELKKKNEELESINNNLEKMILESTAELIFQNKVLSTSQNILYLLPIAIIGIDADGMIVQCNKRALELFNIEGGNIIGGNRKEIFNKEINDFIEVVVKRGRLSQRINLGHLQTIAKGVFMKYPDGQEGIILALDVDET
ncbi:MAG: response regulator [Thermodesulfovibrionales bacterium]